MAPRRNNSGHSAIEVHNLLAMDGDTLDSPRNCGVIGTDHLTRCCVPTGDCFKLNTLEFGLIDTDDLRECVRVTCSNEHCTVGQYMHRECFEVWEEGVLSYLKTIGRARSWSDRQRQQNLWTKKGYDLVFKACGCKCGRGHLKKDLDWMAPTMKSIFGQLDDDSAKKKKKRNRHNQKPMLSLTSNAFHMNALLGTNGTSATIPNSLHALLEADDHHNNNHQLLNANHQQHHQQQQHQLSQHYHQNGGVHRQRCNSQSSSADGCNSSSACSDMCVSPDELIKKQKMKVEAYSERVRTTSGCNGIFSRRLDFSTFNVLPRTRLNSYQIKMEDEGNHGNDETRLFILSSLAQHQKSRVSCVLCEETMFVFDRYPLVDGTFFLSPKQHAPGCIEVKYEGQIQYLTAVCMGCLEGVSADRIVRCRFCAKKWSGASLVLGTMYAYDIFAAMPCCPDRLTCNSCFKLLLYPHQRLNFFSDYSHVVSCMHCTVQDTHFVKPLSYCYTKQPLQNFHQWP